MTLPTVRGPRPGVLFLCVHNAGRSQIAAAIMEDLAGDRVDVDSAGSTPATEVHPAVIAALGERGIDIEGRSPKTWDDEMIESVDVVVTMGCGDTCPVFPGKRYLDWDIEDPSGMTLEEVRSIVTEIQGRVASLIGELAPRP